MWTGWRGRRGRCSAACEADAAHPWALGGFGPGLGGYRPELDAPPPEGLRVGVLRPGRGCRLMPAVAPFARYGHLLINECGVTERARSLLQALTLRLATATRPGTVRFALADPVGQGRHLSAFLRLPASMRVGPSGVGVASAPPRSRRCLPR